MIEINANLRTREDVQEAARKLFHPLKSRFSEGNARVTVGHLGAIQPDTELEGFARPLWGLAPLAAGSGTFDWWTEYRVGLVNGTDVTHQEYWGDITDQSQKAVEAAPISIALSLASESLWDPLTKKEQKQITEWLSGINEVELIENNWLFFRVLTNLGLRKVGAQHDWEQVESDLAQIETFYQGNGWYTDGPNRGDYYIPWAMHFYGLLYARLAEDIDAQRSSVFTSRATQFASDFSARFTSDGEALPFGRSLLYRFAQGCFWGALAFAGVKPQSFSWGHIKALWLQNLRWWLQRPIFKSDGLLALGYGYPNSALIEDYSSPTSPYWAMKAFLPLALPPSHPFWKAREMSLSTGRDLNPQPEAGMVLYSSEGNDFVCALTHGQTTPYNEKYSKFAYATGFGFNIQTGGTQLPSQGIDNTITLSDDTGHYRSRNELQEANMDDGVPYSVWSPWEDVEVKSWIVPKMPWHIRIHSISTERTLRSIEGGFPLAYDRTKPPETRITSTSGNSSIKANNESHVSGLVDVNRRRNANLISAAPNSNVLSPCSQIPMLQNTHMPGEHVLCTAVFGTTTEHDEYWNDVPDVRVREDAVEIDDPDIEHADTIPLRD